jgi:transcriptional regulator with XRE-family HTH domain
MTTTVDRHTYLRDLRHRLGLSQADMAARLGLRTATYQSVEYRRGAAVSRRVMDAARRLEAEPTYSYIREYIAGRSMRMIVHQWAADMDVDRNSPRAIATAIGGSIDEVASWLAGCRHYPSPDRLLAFIRRVDREAAYHQIAEARQGKRLASA